MGSCWMGDHIKSSKASSWMGDEIKRGIPLNYLFICKSIVPYWVHIQLTFYIPPNLPRALGKGAVSSFFFLLSFSQSASSSTCLIGFLPNLVRSKYGWMATKLMGLKTHPGSFGVTGVKKMILRKTLLLLQITWYGLVTNLSCNGLTLSTKVMGLKIHPGSFGVTGVKNVNYYYLND